MDQVGRMEELGILKEVFTSQREQNLGLRRWVMYPLEFVGVDSGVSVVTAGWIIRDIDYIITLDLMNQTIHK